MSIHHISGRNLSNRNRFKTSMKLTDNDIAPVIIVKCFSRNKYFVSREKASFLFHNVPLYIIMETRLLSL